MVYIKRMNIKNFKSFGGEPIKLNFQPGFNIITGPNGSGKSNIIDAVQFVLGELGSKRMRSTDLSGLIYDGAGETRTGRAQIAQVNLYFENTDRGLTIDRDTVSIGRKMDRHGKSDYYLNGKKASRKRVLDLIEMAGITPGGYNIVLQGTATRLSDLTPQERMNALEDLVGITEYDEKKAEAKKRLTEAERKIEVAEARIQEIKRQVTVLEKQRNQAILFNQLDREEKHLAATKLSLEVKKLEDRIGTIIERIKKRETQIEELETEQQKLETDRQEAQNRLDEFNRDAAEKGNTQLPLLRSDLVEKKSVRSSHLNRVRDIERRVSSLTKFISEKEKEIARSNREIETRDNTLKEQIIKKAKLEAELEEKQVALTGFTAKIQAARQQDEANQSQQQEFTESLMQMQESMTGIETELSRHQMTAESLRDKIAGYREREKSVLERRAALEESIREFEELKAEEARKLEDMIQTVGDQVSRQQNIRSTIENANDLAKEAENTITELSAKRELWEDVGSEERAFERITQMGEAGALSGYHGPLRSLIKIDLPYQRAVQSSADGWINAIVVEDIENARTCIDSLKKTRVGMTRFITLETLLEPLPMPELNYPGVVGAVPEIIRYDDYYAPAIHLLWGDTYIVEDPQAAALVTSQGYRAVTKRGDVFEPTGGIIGGYYRRPPNYKKLIPSQTSISNLSTTIKSLRTRLQGRMKELRASGFDLRKFTDYMEDSQDRVKRIDENIAATNGSIERLDRNLGDLRENMRKSAVERENETRLKTVLEERRSEILKQIKDKRGALNELRASRVKAVAPLESAEGRMRRSITAIERQINELDSNHNLQQGLVERVLRVKIDEATEDIKNAQSEIEVLEKEKNSSLEDVKAVEVDVKSLQEIVDKITGEVESTTKIFEYHQRNLRQIEQKITGTGRKQGDAEKSINQLSLDQERIKLQAEQKLDELARLGYGDVIEVDESTGFDERKLGLIRREKRSLGAINQLSLDHYNVTKREYKERSTRINGMEEEKQSILQFIEEIEKEKTEHFMTAYNQICENFSAIFSKLTGGGDGQLELQKPENPFSGGVDLYIQFPGKPMRLATGASGGERSVAAIGYLLAIQRFLKAPFYLFDEIDAHLDDLNTSRLSDVLKENSVDSQFMIISLKDVMVHNADRVYGVFAQNGKSRVIALPMRQARVAA